ncbi:MAG: type II toxin-antitoxin system PemK/MazF family toxin [Pseudanabaena sp. CAN_BIN31]|nr:type II toxin-antitoxin system PemK/MazF family toxin [Pseudanabaena sp. CAN_BIN31]
MAGKRPRQGWIYMINPYRVSLACHRGHQYFYDLTEPSEVNCKHSDCDQLINSSRVFRGVHPYIIWSSDEFQDDANYITTFTVIPLTSQTTFAGLPTVYPIAKTSGNGLLANSYALVHQISTVDGNCFKDSMGNWSIRMGKVSLSDKSEINQTLAYFLNIPTEPNDDWFRKNVSVNLIQKVYGYLSSAEKKKLLETLLDDF